MKKIILFLALFFVMVGTVLAPPPVPFIVYGHVAWNSQMLSGSKLQLTNVETGHTEIVVTDGDGYWQSDAGNYMTVGQTLKVRVLDGCGTADVCEKSVVFNVDFAVIDFDITGTLQCPPISCPSCNCGGGGGCSAWSESKCLSYYPDMCGVTTTTINQQCPLCDITTCPVNPSCPSPPTCPIQQGCPVVVPQECPKNECEGQSSGLLAIISAIIAFLIGGGAVYITLGKSNKVKVIKKDGKDVVQHQHPTISGYHSPDTMHKVAPHKKGELLPRYEKDVTGAWHYVD